MIRRHINFYKKMHKFSHLCTKIHCDKTGFAQKFTAFAQIFTPKFTKIHCIYLLYMLFIRLNVGRASYRNVNDQYQVGSKFFQSPIKILCKYVKNLCWFNQFFQQVQSKIYMGSVNFLYQFYLIILSCRYVGKSRYPLRRHNFLEGTSSLRSEYLLRATCCAVARAGLEKKERGSCNSHPSFYYSEFKLYSLSRKLNIEVPNVRPTFN